MKELDLGLQTQIEAIVNLAEARFINALFSWEASAKHRAENCKCPQCKNEPKRASAAINREVSRVTPPFGLLEDDDLEFEERDPYADYRTKG